MLGQSLGIPRASTTVDGIAKYANGSGVKNEAGTGIVSSALMKNSQTAAKAWVNFNGTGTVAIRASYNVSSITDGGTGIYTVNTSITMADANYAAMVNCAGLNACYASGNVGTQTTNSFPVSTYYISGSSVLFGDCSTVSATIHGNL